MKPRSRIVMIRTAKGCPDSATVVEYEEGREYDVPTELAEAFYGMGAADPAEAHEAADAAESDTVAVAGGGGGSSDEKPKRSRKARA